MEECLIISCYTDLGNSSKKEIEKNKRQINKLMSALKNNFKGIEYNKIGYYEYENTAHIYIPIRFNKNDLDWEYFRKI